jgi:hypothetical protein
MYNPAMKKKGMMSKKKGLVKNPVFSILFHKLVVLGGGRRGSMDSGVRLLRTSDR